MPAGLPYLNLSTTSIKGEKWRDIPGFEFYFKVSCYGRVKRLAYEQTYSDGRIYLRPERILKPTIVRYYNRFMGDYTNFLRIAITVAGRLYPFTIPRLVYSVFIAPLDPLDKKTVILLPKGKELDIRPANLTKSSVSQKQKRITSLKRAPALIPTEKGEKLRRKISSEVNRKQVSRYSDDGIMIATYKSLTEASRKTGVSTSSISSVACGRWSKGGGFIWRHGNLPQINVSDIGRKVREQRELQILKHGKKLTQYDKEGVRVSTYPTVSEASRQTKINASDISMAANNKKKSAGGFFWKAGYGPKKINPFGDKKLPKAGKPNANPK